MSSDVIPLRLEVSTLSYSCAESPILKEIQLDLNYGDLVVIVGANGSGKTSLLRSVGGLIPHLRRFSACNLEGSLQWNGNALTDNAMAKRFWRSCGVLFQYPDHNFATTTVIDELLFAARVASLSKSDARLRVADAVKTFDLSRILHSKVDQLSEGTKQLVALSSLFIRRPQFLLLDEPTAMLDVDNRARVIEAVREYRAGSPNGIVIVATHEPDAFSTLGPNRFVVVKDGSGTEVATIEEAVASFGVRESALGEPVWKTTSDGVDILIAELLGVYYRASESPVFAGLGFSLKEGRATLLTGPNGCGKTSLCRTLAGLHRKFHGSIKFRGRDYRTHPPCPPKEVAFVSQIPSSQFITDEVRTELLATITDSCDHKAVLDLASPFLAAFGVSLDADPLALSYGQQKVVALLCYLNAPDMLIIDEPVICLDVGQRDAVRRLLTEYMRRGTTLLIGTHQAEAFSRMVDREVSLDQRSLRSQKDAPT